MKDDLEVSESMEPGSMQMISLAVYACHHVDYRLPPKSAVKDRRVELVELVGGHRYVRTIFGPAIPDEEGLFGVALKRAVQSIYDFRRSLTACRCG